MPISQGVIDLSSLVSETELASILESRFSPIENPQFRCLEFPLNNVAEITIEHDRGYIPEYQLRNEQGKLVEVPVNHIDENTLTICSVIPVTGTLYIY
ncbi:hypothetical protein VPHD485_0012 [Vibrio phage D485]